jgi:hypothetical protein
MNSILGLNDQDGGDADMDLEYFRTLIDSKVDI